MVKAYSGPLESQISLTFSQQLFIRPHYEPAKSSSTWQDIIITQGRKQSYSNNSKLKTDTCSSETSVKYTGLDSVASKEV
jgi:hypothetical protein